MREIKFRSFDGVIMHSWQELLDENMPVNILYSKNNIMQYTGLKDKNDVEIYEGDIVVKNIYWDVQKTELVRFTVKFIYGCFMLEDRDKRRYNISKYNEVIGNIHENEELLDEN